jgi:hypothetical protein
MGLKIIRQVEWDNEIVYSLNFLETDCLSQGYSFPCDKWGIVDPNIPIEAKENYRKCLDGTYDVIVQGIFEHERDFKIPVWSEYNFHKDWLNRALALESKEDKVKAQAIFDDAFKKASYRPSQPF